MAAAADPDAKVMDQSVNEPLTIRDHLDRLDARSGQVKRKAAEYLARAEAVRRKNNDNDERDQQQQNVYGTQQNRRQLGSAQNLNRALSQVKVNADALHACQEEHQRLEGELKEVREQYPQEAVTYLNIIQSIERNLNDTEQSLVNIHLILNQVDGYRDRLYAFINTVDATQKYYGTFVYQTMYAAVNTYMIPSTQWSLGKTANHLAAQSFHLLQQTQNEILDEIAKSIQIMNSFNWRPEEDQKEKQIMLSVLNDEKKETQQNIMLDEEAFVASVTTNYTQSLGNDRISDEKMWNANPRLPGTDARDWAVFAASNDLLERKAGQQREYGRNEALLWFLDHIPNGSDRANIPDAENAFPQVREWHSDSSSADDVDQAVFKKYYDLCVLHQMAVDLPVDTHGANIFNQNTRPDGKELTMLTYLQSVLKRTYNRGQPVSINIVPSDEDYAAHAPYIQVRRTDVPLFRVPYVRGVGQGHRAQSFKITGGGAQLGLVTFVLLPTNDVCHENVVNFFMDRSQLGVDTPTYRLQFVQCDLANELREVAFYIILDLILRIEYQQPRILITSLGLTLAVDSRYALPWLMYFNIQYCDTNESKTEITLSRPFITLANAQQLIGWYRLTGPNDEGPFSGGDEDKKGGSESESGDDAGRESKSDASESGSQRPPLRRTRRSPGSRSSLAEQLSDAGHSQSTVPYPLRNVAGSVYAHSVASEQSALVNRVVPREEDEESVMSDVGSVQSREEDEESVMSDVVSAQSGRTPRASRQGSRAASPRPQPRRVRERDAESDADSEASQVSEDESEDASQPGGRDYDDDARALAGHAFRPAELAVPPSGDGPNFNPGVHRRL